MQYRSLGNTGLAVSAVGFGCGAVGGILVKGSRQEMLQVVARAIDLGVSYFDTAPLYGNGASEANLGLVLEALQADVVVGTKVRLAGEDLGDIAAAVTRSVDASLMRLKRERIDLIQLHNSVGSERRPERQWVTPDDVAAAGQAFQTLQKEGKVRYWGINGLGDSAAVHQVLDSGAQTVQSCFNLINPSAGVAVSPGFPFQDYGGLIDKAAARGMGVLAIRVLAGGALSGSASRHPNAAQTVDPIASGNTFAEDVAWSRRFDFLVAEGYAGSLVDAAIRFVLHKPEVATALVGISTLDQLEQAVASANKGPLPAAAFRRLHEVWQGA